MLRICGATQERDALSRSRCWCRGLFCGRGGGRLSQELRRDFRNGATARSLDELKDIIGQVDLFELEARRDKWLARVDQALAGSRKVKKPRAAAAAEGVRSNA